MLQSSFGTVDNVSSAFFNIRLSFSVVQSNLVIVETGHGKLLICEDVSFALQLSAAVSRLCELNCP